MPWHPDVPDLPIEKPKEIEKLEQLDPAVRNGMPDRQIDETVEGIAYAVASEYHKQLGGNYDDCVDIVSVALNVTGSSLGGILGTAMIAASEHEARKACRIVFPEPLELDF